MNFETALRAAAPALPEDAVAGFLAARPEMAQAGLFETPLRAAHLIGQCAHESAGFLHRIEVLSYRSAERLVAVFPRHFRNRATAARYVGRPRALANRVYANRIGNGDPASGDGYRYRGRGWLQLTGRANYARMGARLGLDLEARPERAGEPATAWRIAAAYLAGRRSAGRTALEWADRNNVERVTRIVNGGLNGLAERRILTARAAAALGPDAMPRLTRGERGDAVLRLQIALARAGHPPGPLDGDFGPRTEAALKGFQEAQGLEVNGTATDALWQLLCVQAAPRPLSRATASIRSALE